MTFWPVIISSIKASARAIVTCWRRKNLEERLVIARAANTMHTTPTTTTNARMAL